jgi:hypothetical protein
VGDPLVIVPTPPGFVDTVGAAFVELVVVGDWTSVGVVVVVVVVGRTEFLAPVVDVERADFRVVSDFLLGGVWRETTTTTPATAMSRTAAAIAIIQ